MARLTPCGPVAEERHNVSSMFAGGANLPLPRGERLLLQANDKCHGLTDHSSKPIRSAATPVGAVIQGISAARASTGAEAKLIRALANCIGAAAKRTGAAVKPIRATAQSPRLSAKSARPPAK
jgi:hypothetical protein